VEANTTPNQEIRPLLLGALPVFNAPSSMIINDFLLDTNALANLSSGFADGLGKYNLEKRKLTIIASPIAHCSMGLASNMIVNDILLDAVGLANFLQASLMAWASCSTT
jgi:hypothetical protein